MGAKNAKLASYEDLPDAVATPDTADPAARVGSNDDGDAVSVIGNGTTPRTARGGARAKARAQKAAAKERRKRSKAEKKAGERAAAQAAGRKRAAPSRFLLNRRKRAKPDSLSFSPPAESPARPRTEREWVVEDGEEVPVVVPEDGTRPGAAGALDAALLRKSAGPWPLNRRQSSGGAWNAFVHHPGVKELLEDGASVNARDRRNATPLHNASGVLVAAAAAVPGAKKKKKKNKGASAGDGEAKSLVVAELLAGGADVCACDDRGETPVHRAAQCGNDAVVRQLLAACDECAAAADAANKHGNTPLHLAAEEGFLSTVQVLLAAGATVVARNADGCKPMDIAKSDIRYDMLQIDAFRADRRSELAAVPLGEWSLVDVTDFLILVDAENVHYVTPLVHNKVSGRVLVDSGASADALVLLGMDRKPAEGVAAQLRKMFPEL